MHDILMTKYLLERILIFNKDSSNGTNVVSYKLGKMTYNKNTQIHSVSSRLAEGTYRNTHTQGVRYKPSTATSIISVDVTCIPSNAASHPSHPLKCMTAESTRLTIGLPKMALAVSTTPIAKKLSTTSKVGRIVANRIIVAYNTFARGHTGANRVGVC